MWLNDQCEFEFNRRIFQQNHCKTFGCFSSQSTSSATLVLPPINSAVISIDLEEFYLLLHQRSLRRNCNRRGFESRIWTLAPSGKSVKFPNLGGTKRHNPHSPASRTLFVVEILDVSYLKSTVNFEQAWSKNTFDARPICEGERLTGGD